LPDLPEVREEIELARNTKGHGSRKRQVKRLAGVLRGRDEDRQAIERALAGQAEAHRLANAGHQHLENLRNRLCAPETFDTALADVRASHPELDAAKLARLAKSVHRHQDKRAAREIFRTLRDAEGG
jgi:ribosome-associated protein